jgi:hypothetical protein
MIAMRFLRAAVCWAEVKRAGTTIKVSSRITVTRIETFIEPPEMRRRMRSFHHALRQELQETVMRHKFFTIWGLTPNFPVGV